MDRRASNKQTSSIAFGNVRRYKSYGKKEIIETIIHREILSLPEICIIGVIPETLALRAHDNKLINFCLIHVKRLIAIHWKSVCYILYTYYYYQFILNGHVFLQFTFMYGNYLVISFHHFSERFSEK